MKPRKNYGYLLIIAIIIAMGIWILQPPANYGVLAIDEETTKEGIIEPERIPVTDIELTDVEKSISIGETYTIEANVVPVNADEQIFSYVSCNSTVATVTSRGQVKGVAKGVTAISVSAGNVTRQITIIVTGAVTDRLDINTDYLVLGIGESYTIRASAVPAGAPQVMSYKSIDSVIASVSTYGVINASNLGSTCIVISNGDKIGIVTVIVNVRSAENSRTESTAITPAVSNEENSMSQREIVLIEKIKKETGMIYISQTNFGELTPEILRALYSVKGMLTVDAGTYSIVVDGVDIVNPNNALPTAIVFTKSGDDVSFEIGNKADLPGRIHVNLPADAAALSRLYIYNPSEKKYERLNAKYNDELVLDTGGIYKLTDKNLDAIHIDPRWVAIVGAFVLAMIVVFIVARRRYWFW
jgi:hypothetical protein